MYVEIESADQLALHLKDVGHCQKIVVQGADLGQLSDQLLGISGAGAVFLGCRLAPSVAAHLTQTGAIVLPELADRPYRPFRSRLYTPEELMDGCEEGRPASFWESSRDARIYHHYRAAQESGGPAILEALAQRLHDFAIDDARSDLLTGDPAKRCVAIMGGHAMRRDDPAYLDVAAIAHGLSRLGYFLVSGGGPGAMEATNLGAWLGSRDQDSVAAAVKILSAAPSFRDAGWFESALAARREFPDGLESLGIPTWFYGHEPSNLFATHVAKYFANSLREDTLLAIATYGVVFAPGSAGTIQEIFQDAAQNHYGTCDVVSPMVFFGTKHWREDKPVGPLIEALAVGRQYAGSIGWCDAVDEVVRFIESHPPVDYVPS